jgi:hypothetical protein
MQGFLKSILLKSGLAGNKLIKFKFVVNLIKVQIFSDFYHDAKTRVLQIYPT